MKASVAAATVCLLLAASARAQTFPARSGESGILDVPDAESLGQGNGQFAVELRFDHTPGLRDDFGPLPLYTVAGVTPHLDVGMTMREWGQPGDARPPHVLFGAAAKLQLWAPAGPVPGAALGLVYDRFNDDGVLGTRLAVSTERGPYRLAAFGGVETRTAAGLGGLGGTAGVAASLGATKWIELAAEALTGPRGANLGLAARWKLTPTIGMSLGGNYFPRDEAFRFAVTLAVSPPPRRPAAARPVEAMPPPPTEEPSAQAGLVENRPHFRLRIPMAGAQQLALARHQQHGVTTPRALGVVGAPAKAEAAGARAATPSLEELAETQVREQEALATAREKRVRSSSDQIDAREKAALEEARRLEERERELTSREQQLDAREQRTAIRAAPTQQLRQLESLETQLSAQERQLLAQERSLAPAIDAARGREKDAATREDAEGQEANRLSASVGAAATTALQVELRKQALAAKNRQLASFEAKLVAKSERVDALERQLRVKGERLDAWSRRLDTRAERLDLLEKRAAETRPAAPKPVEPPKPAGAPKDKAVFVMVVKSPTAIVKERAAGPAPTQTGAALHPGVAVEKAVAAATVITFATPASQISELDRETLDNIAKLAARERCELLIWARAKDPSLMAEAQRRADEIKTRAIASGPLDAKQVVTRITTRPGAQGVDVVVSALRETAKPATQAAPEPASGAALLAGESGKRQIREAVQTAQPAIEACVGEFIAQKNLARAEGVLKVTVAPDGKVLKVLTGGGDLSGGRMDECLSAAARTWAFPAADAEYVVDVPITVIRGGAK